MRVMHVISGTGVGGAEGVLLRLMIGLRSKGVEQQVTSIAPCGPMAEEMRRQGFEVASTELEATWQLPRTVRRCASEIRAFRADVVQTWMYHADLLGGIAAKVAGVRHVIWGIRMSHMVPDMPRATRAVIRACALTSRWLPTRIVAAAEASRAAHEALGYDLRGFTVIPNGFALGPELTPALRDAARSALAIPPAASVVVGSIGRYDPFKDQPTLLRAFAGVATELPGAHLVLIGRGCDDANAALIALIGELGLTDRVTLAGERMNARELLPAFDVYCLSSRSEGFPNVIGEAMAASVPCVATDVGDAAMLLGGTGVLVPPGNPAALAKGLRTILDEPPSTRRARGVRARARIAEHFTMTHTTDAYLALYQDVLAHGHRPEHR